MVELKIKCPICNGTDVKQIGENVFGIPIYICNECGWAWTEL